MPTGDARDQKSTENVYFNLKYILFKFNHGRRLETLNFYVFYGKLVLKWRFWSLSYGFDCWSLRMHGRAHKVSCFPVLGCNSIYSYRNKIIPNKLLIFRKSQGQNSTNCALFFRIFLRISFVIIKK